MTIQFDQYLQIAAQPIEEARSLPFEAYRDPTLFEKEVTDIFHHEWVFVCAEQEIPNAGDYYALDVAGESVMILRGSDGQCRAMSNNCRHRGTPLLEYGFGNLSETDNGGATDKIVCPYHAWTFSDNGTAKGIPIVGDVKLDKAAHCLPTFALESWLGLLFIHLGENPSPLAERLSSIDDYLVAFEPQRFQRGFTGSFEHWQSNWKLAMENAMESYHLFKVHKATLETTTPTRQAYYIAGSAEWTLSGGAMVMSQSKISEWLQGKTPEIYKQYVLVSLPPSFVGILTYDSFDWIHVMPVNATESLIRSGGISTSLEGYADKTVQSFTQAFFDEDKFICERVQKGMSSRQGKGGKLVSMERIVADFHQFLASRHSAAITGEYRPVEFHQGERAEGFLHPDRFGRFHAG